MADSVQISTLRPINNRLNNLRKEWSRFPSEEVSPVEPAIKKPYKLILTTNSKGLAAARLESLQKTLEEERKSDSSEGRDSPILSKRAAGKRPLFYDEDLSAKSDSPPQEKELPVKRKKGRKPKSKPQLQPLPIFQSSLKTPFKIPKKKPVIKLQTLTNGAARVTESFVPSKEPASNTTEEPMDCCDESASVILPATSDETMDWEPDILNQLVTNERRKLQISQEVGDLIGKLPELDEVKPTGHWVLIPDTNAFITAWPFLQTLLNLNVPDLGLCLLYIPQMVLRELDGLKLSSSPEVNRNARKAIFFLNECFSKNHPRVKGQTLGMLQSINSTLDKDDSTDDKILKSVLQIRDVIRTKFLVFVSNDINLRNKALLEDVVTYSTTKFDEFVKQKFKLIIEKVADIFKDILLSVMASKGKERYGSLKNLFKDWIAEKQQSDVIVKAVEDMTNANVNLDAFFKSSFIILNHFFEIKAISEERFFKIHSYLMSTRRKHLALSNSDLLFIHQHDIQQIVDTLKEICVRSYNDIVKDWTEFVNSQPSEVDGISKVEDLIEMLSDLINVWKSLLMANSGRYIDLSLFYQHLSGLTKVPASVYQEKLKPKIPDVVEIRRILDSGISDFIRLQATFRDQMDGVKLRLYPF